MADITSIRNLSRAGWSQRRIARELGHDRATIKKYAATGEPPDSEPEADGSDLKPAISTPGFSTGRVSVCEPFRDRIEALLEKGLTAERIWWELRENHGFPHAYQSVKRFFRKLKVRQPKRVWRMECQPGEEAQVDFGRVRTLRRADGKLGYSNVLRVTLSFSRKGYTETVPHQNTECFLRALENAFRHFGGVPATLRIDNLKAAVKKADWYDPELNPKILAFAEHYQTAFLPTRPYTPQHKGKVESDIGYVKNSALKGREFTSPSRMPGSKTGKLTAKRNKVAENYETPFRVVPVKRYQYQSLLGGAVHIPWSSTPESSETARLAFARIVSFEY